MHQRFGPTPTQSDNRIAELTRETATAHTQIAKANQKYLNLPRCEFMVLVEHSGAATVQLQDLGQRRYAVGTFRGLARKCCGCFSDGTHVGAVRMRPVMSATRLDEHSGAV
jgi:hypothetical protein